MQEDSMKAINVAIRARRELRLLMHETPTGDGELDRRILLAVGWEDDPILEAPLLMIPLDAVEDVVAALRALAS
jgi:hypothetical protein